MGGDRADLAWEAVEKHLRCCTMHIGLLVRHASLICCRKMGASAIEMQKQHHWNDYFPRWLLLEMNDYYLTFHHFRLFHFSSSIFKVVARRHDGSQAMETVGRSRKQENLADRRVGFQSKSAVS